MSSVADNNVATMDDDHLEAVVDFITKVRERVGTVVVGQDEVVERLLIALFTGGHLLLQGVPGLAKTLLVSVISKTIDLDFARIQFTIDLLPSDILGSEILDQKTNEFRIHKGPVFTNLLLADEINRAAPKVQGALLEAMQERKVTIGGENFSLPAPFLVIATQNPVEQAGTFELPEAQLDRFMLLHRLDYPEPDHEKEILKRNAALGIRMQDKGAVAKTEFDVLENEPVGSTDELISAMQAVHSVYVSDAFIEHCVEVVNRTRKHPLLELGCSPRAGISLIKASRARALIHGRKYVVPDDLYALAEDVILHRIRLNYEALADGHTPKIRSSQYLERIPDINTMIRSGPRTGELDAIEPLDWRQFMIALRKLADSFNYGTDRSPFLGSGVEYVQSRRYQYGDPIRAIDWRVTARTGKVFVKEYETPKQMPCFILFDTSASMVVSSGQRSKYATALHIAGGLGLACLDRVSPVGLVTTGELEYRVEPSLSKDQIMQWLHHLRRYRFDEQTQLAHKLKQLSASLQNRALLIVISDLHESECLSVLKLVAQQHDVVVVQLRDPAEDEIHGTGYFRAVEPETGREFVTHGKRIWQDQELVEQELKRGGISHICLRIDEPFAHKLRWFFKARGGLGKGAR